MREHRRLFWTAAWLALALVAIKGYYLGTPAALTLHAAGDYLRDLEAVSFVDVLCVGVLWAAATAALRLAGDRVRVRSAITVVFAAVGAALGLYALASVFFFSVFGGFLTYPLLALVGDVHMLRSSVAAQTSAPTLLALAGVPLLYLALVAATLKWAPVHRGPWWRPRVAALAPALGAPRQSAATSNRIRVRRDRTARVADASGMVTCRAPPTLGDPARAGGRTVASLFSYR